MPVARRRLGGGGTPRVGIRRRGRARWGTAPTTKDAGHQCRRVSR